MLVGRWVGRQVGRWVDSFFCDLQKYGQTSQYTELLDTAINVKYKIKRKNLPKIALVYNLSHL